jgi:hypothetical protein
MDSMEPIDAAGAVNPITRGDALGVHNGPTPQKEGVVSGQQTIYKLHFIPKDEVTGDTAVEVAASAEQVAAYLNALAAEPEIEAEPDGNQGMIYRTSNRCVAARFNFPDMWVDGEETPKEPHYTDGDRRPADSGLTFPMEYRVWSCRAE